MGAAGSAAWAAPNPTPGLRPGSGAPGVGVPILPLTSTSDVFIPPRGRAFMKFSFDFPEPSVEFAGYRFGFLVL